MESLKKYAELSALSPAQILRNLENGFFMSHQEQMEAAEYIRQLQNDVKTLADMVNLQAEHLAAMRLDLKNALKGFV
jgi:Mg2+ and Co2+ transporter CorA